MQTFRLNINREAMIDTLVERAYILGYNDNRNFRVIIHLKPEKPMSEGEDHRHSPHEHIWKLEDLIMELKSAVRQGDCASWPENPLTSMEEAILPFVEFDREPEKGNCIKRNDNCYLQSWSLLPIYRIGNCEAFKHAVNQLIGFENALRKLR